MHHVSRGSTLYHRLFNEHELKGALAMKGKIAFEEHFSLPETLDDSRAFAGGSGKWEEFARQILDVGDERLEGMERNGIEFAIVSLNAPAIQGILDTRKAIDVAKRANNHL